MSNANRFWAVPDNITLLVGMAARGETYGKIAETLQISENAVRSKLKSMKLRAAPNPKPEPDKNYAVARVAEARENYAGVRFEDHPLADRDKRIGRVPSREHGYSITGNAAFLCLGA